MRLVWFELDGFKRFAEHCKVNLDSKLVAIVGPNEAGRTSLLEALQHFNHSEAFASTGPSQETTRGASFDEDHTVIEATYILDDEDRTAIAQIPEAAEVRWYAVCKRVKGEAFYVTQKPRPKRDMSKRRQASSAVRDVSQSIERSQKERQSGIEDDDAHSNEVVVKTLLKTLDDNAQTLPGKAIEFLSQAANLLEFLAPPDSSHPARDVPNLLRELVEHESAEHPEAAARNALYERRPRFLFFSDADRLLQSEYDLHSFYKQPAHVRQKQTIPTETNNSDFSRDAVVASNVKNIR